MITMTKSYSELMKYKTFEERFEYLKLNGQVGDLKFNGHRYLNQLLYKCPEWKRVRRDIIIRDLGMDLGCDDHPIGGKILVHHLNPLSVEDVIDRKRCVFDPENLITVSHQTHNALHYGTENYISTSMIAERRPNDTSPWRE